MNDSLWLELERLKERQTHLTDAVAQLDIRIGTLANRIAEQGKIPAAEENRGSPPYSGPVPPPLPPMASIPRPVPQPPLFVAPPVAAAVPVAASSYMPPGEIVPPSPIPPIEPASVAAASPESFEMRLGTYWLVRIGVVAMLTALVFFGTYAYQNYIGRIGPAGKVTLLYLASGILLGVGTWLQRRTVRESLRNYAQVLFAGGMAAVYFTTYAAYHFPTLQVITHAAVDGALLLGWAGFMAWMADRAKSEKLAMFAIGLAYYTSVITRVGHFTLYSNLVLAAAALVFLIRNRWAALSFGCLVATYAGYGFWRFWQDGGWHWAEPGAGLWTGIYFLAGYWAVFTTSVFLSRHREFAGVNRASFATLNNAAFFLLFVLTLLQVQSGGFWKFCALYGAVLLGAAALARVRLREEPVLSNTYLTQGLLLVTAALVSKFSGLQLALLLALESVVLWLTGSMRRNIVMRTGACLSGALAVLWAFDGIDRNDPRGAWLGAGVGALLVFNAFWAHIRVERAVPRLLRPSPAFFSALTLLVWSFALWQNLDPLNRPAAFALLGLALALSVHLTKLRELGLLAQLLLPCAAILFSANQTMQSQPEPWWGFAILTGASLALVHWWQRQTVVECPRALRIGGQAVAALMMVGAIGFWLPPKLDLAQWVWVSALLALAVTAYGAVMRNGVLMLAAQTFLALSIGNFLLHAGDSALLPWLPALAPFAATVVLALSGSGWGREVQHSGVSATWVRQIALGFGRLAMALLVWWTFAYINRHELVWVFTALGAASFALAGWRRDSEFLVYAAVLDIFALGSLVFHLVLGTAVFAPNFVAVLIWMLQQQVARQNPERYPAGPVAHNTTIVAASVALWMLCTRWIMQGAGGFYLTAGWSVLAFVLLALGIGLRERMYRWAGLGILAAALGRVVLFDVWKLDTLYRILSFFALGLVLLVLGFIYNRFQERLRQWL
jgi:uncharacterized membrane protein